MVEKCCFWYYNYGMKIFTFRMFTTVLLNHDNKIVRLIGDRFKTKDKEFIKLIHEEMYGDDGGRPYTIFLKDIDRYVDNGNIEELYNMVLMEML